MQAIFTEARQYIEIHLKHTKAVGQHTMLTIIIKEIAMNVSIFI